MGYSLQTELAPRNRRPAVSSHPRKHVARRSRLQQRGYRFYAPSLGRFLSRDPIGQRGGRNSYAFTQNNAVCWRDILGLATQDGAANGKVKPPCCGATKIKVEWSGAACVSKSGFSVNLKHTLVEGENLDLCEASALVTMSAEIPNYSEQQVKDAYDDTGWPPDGTVAYPNAPFFTEKEDWGWESLPFTDPPALWAGKDAAGNSLPTIYSVKFKIQVRDKASKAILPVSLTYSFRYRNYKAGSTPTMSDDDATIYDVSGVEGSLLIAKPPSTGGSVSLP